jgi:hypothetical protein
MTSEPAPASNRAFAEPEPMKWTDSHGRADDAKPGSQELTTDRREAEKTRQNITGSSRVIQKEISCQSKMVPLSGYGADENSNETCRHSRNDRFNSEFQLSEQIIFRR